MYDNRVFPMSREGVSFRKQERISMPEYVVEVRPPRGALELL